MAENPLYGRKYKLSVFTFGGRTITLAENQHFTFTIDKNIMRMYQWGEITIYNLSPDTETDILENGKTVTLECGYKNGAYGRVFKGEIRQPIRGKEDAVTYFLKLVCIDGDDALNLGICNFVLSSGQTLQQIATQVARSSSVPFEIRVDPDLDQQKTQRGKVVFGKPGDTMRSLARNNDALFFIDDGIGYLSSFKKTPPASVPSINAESGMIGIPEQTDQGVKIKTLINPNFKVDNWLSLNNRDIRINQVAFGVPQVLLDLDGLYRILGLQASGDTRGNDWYYDLTTVSQAGQVAAMMSNISQTGAG